MKTFDPFNFLKNNETGFGLPYRAPEEAVDSWRKLAERIDKTLRGLGIPVAGISDEFHDVLRSGAVIRISQMFPFGVSLYWEPPLFQADSYTSARRGNYGAGPHPLLSYAVNSSIIIVEALCEMLARSGFRVMIEADGLEGRRNRILEAP
ncbi:MULTISPECIES: hypothetical protein [Actinosynnema]|uniref:hypothetical protein n=1 Tax=Actinosynnema TaxID=40566 RepID=UPI0020A35A82|nr:hypothetical protein [Actinosynnema pretiosum]